jgi:hypothetical protein
MASRQLDLALRLDHGGRADHHGDGGAIDRLGAPGTVVGRVLVSVRDWIRIAQVTGRLGAARVIRQGEGRSLMPDIRQVDRGVARPSCEGFAGAELVE